MFTFVLTVHILIALAMLCAFLVGMFGSVRMAPRMAQLLAYGLVGTIASGTALVVLHPGAGVLHLCQNAFLYALVTLAGQYVLARRIEGFEWTETIRSIWVSVGIISLGIITITI